MELYVLQSSWSIVQCRYNREGGVQTLDGNNRVVECKGLEYHGLVTVDLKACEVVE